MRLGIDFGTTRTVVSAALDGRYAVVSFELGDGFCDYLRGLAVQLGDTLYFGDEAAALLTRGAPGVTGVVRSVKRAVSERRPQDRVEALTGRPVTALELATAYLRWVHVAIRTRSNLELDEGERLQVMAAVPAGAGSRQRFLTIEAFTRAGFEVSGLVNEPTAAAVEYARRHLKGVGKRSPKRYVVIYDLGGGTFDTAAISLEGRRFSLLRSEGVPTLGGDDFDERILELAIARAGAGVTMTPANRVAALERCREAKEGLTPASRRLLVELSSPASAQAEEPAPVVLSTRELYAACGELVECTLAPVERLFAGLRDHGIDPDNTRELGGLYLVGGATAFPAVARALRKRYGRKIILAPQPHASTAVGLAIAGDPDAGVLVREATTRYFGVWREGANGREIIFDPIFSRDALPGDAAVVAERRYTPAHAVGHLRFLECSALGQGGRPEGQLTPWPTVLFPYDPILVDHPALGTCSVSRRPDAPRDHVVETYTYERDGTIALQIENATRGYRQTYVLGAR